MSELLDVAYKMNKELFNAGVLDEITMRQLDALYLTETKELTPEDIKRIRMKNNVSQSVFAVLLGTGKTTVQHWEQGVKKPSGMAKKLLDLVDRKGLAILT